MITNLQDVLHSEIPLTKTIGIQVIDYSNNELTLKAPLENNINHKNTAFGGSLYSVAVLSGWGLVYLLLEHYKLTGQIVIQETTTKFLKPVTHDITSKCAFTSPEHYLKFIKMYQRKGIARITLQSRIICDNETRVLFTGRYVVQA